MCYGYIPYCPHEIKFGAMAGECGRRNGQPCPDNYETEEEFWQAMDEYKEYQELKHEADFP